MAGGVDGHLILSPHLDDAVLSCFDHSVTHRNAGPARVVTVFTRFGASEPPEYQQRVLAASGCTSISAYERMRLDEDDRAMDAFGVKLERLGFTDAGFRRSSDGSFLYPDYRKLTPFRIDKESESLVSEVADAFRQLDAGSWIWVPIGVGGHIDHVITRVAAEQIWERGRIVYYLEFPYAMRPWKYRLEHLQLMLSRRCSKLAMSSAKLEAIKLYKSQVPFLFRTTPQYRECLIFP